MVRCRVERRVRVDKCHRCWAFDHLARECMGPDRRNLCLKCGKSGHKREGCKAEEECPLCEKKGHRAGSGRCGAFKRALEHIKGRERSRERARARQEEERRWTREGREVRGSSVTRHQTLFESLDEVRSVPPGPPDVQRGVGMRPGGY